MMFQARASARDHILQKRLEIYPEIEKHFFKMFRVRGLGAICALEVVKDRISKEPDKELAGRIIQECVCRGVIILGAGLYGNVIRMLSPLVITDDQLEEGLGVMETVFAEFAQG
jgi:4-aminobutyrate aminotransferase/(S)-3-amino-2-methylpropionate transaminase